MEAKFGRELARLICCRIAILQEAKRLSSVPTCPPLLCRSDQSGCYTVALGDTHRLTFEPVHQSTGSHEADMIQQIKILGVITS